MIPITGFNPGGDPTQQGVIVDCTNMLPSVRGMKAAGLGADVGLSALPAACDGAAMVRLIDSTARVLAGTATALYESNATGWDDRSKVGGYTSGNGWVFCQFGDATIATNLIDAVQVSTVVSTAFVDLAGTPPKAAICISAAGFVVLFDYNDGVDIFNDGWWCSALYDHTDWTPSPATQSANGRLLQTYGKITAAKSLGNNIVAYKDQSMYMGAFVGPPTIWAWRQITSDTGAFGQGSVISTGDTHYFIGKNGMFRYDGSRPVPIGTIEIRDLLRDRVNLDFAENIVSGYDAKTSLCYWFIPSVNSTGTPDEALIFNTITGQFGRMTRNVCAMLEYVSFGMDWSSTGYGAVEAAWSDFDVNRTWRPPEFYGDSVGLSFISDDEFLYKLESIATSSSITTGDTGDDTYYSTIQRVRPRFIASPSSANMTHQYKTGEGDSLQTGVTVAMSDNKFDLLKSARFHRLKLDFTGDVELSGYEMKLKKNGTR